MNRLNEWEYREIVSAESEADAQEKARRIALERVPGASFLILSTRRTKTGRYSMLIVRKRGG